MMIKRINLGALCPDRWKKWLAQPQQPQCLGSCPAVSEKSGWPLWVFGSSVLVKKVAGPFGPKKWLAPSGADRSDVDRAASMMIKRIQSRSHLSSSRWKKWLAPSTRPQPEQLQQRWGSCPAVSEKSGWPLWVLKRVAGPFGSWVLVKKWLAPLGQSRVEVWRGGLGRCLCSLLARSFVCGCHIISTMLRFHTPLIKPGGPISGTRLSDKASLMAIHTRSPTNRCRFVR